MTSGRGRRLRLLAAGLLSALLLAACSPYSGSEAQKVREWANQNSFVANHDQMISDITLVKKAVTQGSAKVVRTICGGLASDVGTAYVTLPTPDQILTNELNAADQDIVDAATSCSGVASVHSATMTSDLARFREGVDELKEAQGRLASFGFSWPEHL